MLAKLKTLVKGILQYLIDNPIQRVIVVACGVAIVALIVTLIVVGAVKRKKRKQQAAACACEQPTEELAVEESAPAQQEATQETPTEEQAAEVAVAEEAAEEPAPETAKEEVAVEEAAKESTEIATTPTETKAEKAAPAPKKAKTATAKSASTKKASEAKQPTAQKATTKKTVAEKPATKVVEEKKPATAVAEKKKPSAKYTGKWVICKLALTDGKDNVVEENYFFELRASNGERLLVSEEYTSYAGAIKGIQTHKDNVGKGNFRITLSKKGDYIFKLLTAKNTLLCTGANYKSLERCERAIASTKRFAATAVVQDEVEEIRMAMPAEEETVQTETTVPENGYTGKWIINTKGNEEVGVMYYFELFASNGEKLLTSEEYTTYEGAVNAVATHKANIAKGNFRISITKKGDYLFKLLGGNGQLLCMGEHYKTRSRCESAVESVKRFSQSAPVYKYGELNN